MTLETIAVLQVMLEAPTHAHYGLQIAGRVHRPTGTVYPILARLEKAGWGSPHWEERDTSEWERPRRRLYTLTGTGAHAARAALADAHQLTLTPPATPRPL